MTLLRFDRKFTKRRTVTGFLDLVETNMSGAVSELFGRVDRKARIELGETVHELHETKSSLSIYSVIAFTSRLVVITLHLKTSEDPRANSFNAIPPVLERAQVLRIPLFPSEGRPQRCFAQDARSRTSLGWAA
jgi:hypothetical protein